ncbi:DUF308 domain-containing protein [Patescibacteria group bacterium]|nr:DUF308 domain-containing protein [Patescibacteria group bacterium]MDE1946644.1 DUF308 domain-containing protein [Patescibacteria group bacterium]MDE2010597.1 DUF308 domain-containing protein [Patescibacteria group bacterium]MDE2232956.1 DUF308 domain-containing protein [Patescibacteria group bacterium]
MAYNLHKTTYRRFFRTFFLLLSVFLLTLNISAAQSNSPTPTPTPTPTVTSAGVKSYTLLEPLPCIPYTYSVDLPGGGGMSKTVDCPGGAGAPQTTVDLSTFFIYAFNLLIALSAVAAVFMMVWGGFEYMTSDAWNKKSAGKDKFWNAIWGLLMVLGSYLILKTVNPKLVAIPASIPPISVPATQQESPLTLFDQLNAEAQKYNAVGQEYVDQAQQAKNTVNQLLQEKTDLQSKIDTLPSEVQMAQIDKKINDAQANMIVLTGKSIMSNGGISNTIQNINAQNLDNSISAKSIDEQINNGINFIDQQRDTRNAQLTQLGEYDSISKPGGINDNANADQLMLKLQGESIKINSATIDPQFFGLAQSRVWVGQDYFTITDFKSTTVDELNKIQTSIKDIQDPVLKQNLEDELLKVNSSFSQKFSSGK